MTRVALAALATLATAAVLLAGCGDTGAGRSASTTTENDREKTAAIIEAVSTYAAAYLGGDAATARSLLSPRCQQRMTPEEMQAMVGMASDLWGSASIKSVDVNSMSGDRARVSYTFDNASLDRTAERWVRVEGQWRADDC